VVALAPNDPNFAAQIASGAIQLDQRPERNVKGTFPIIQQAANGDPAPGIYVSSTSRPANDQLPVFAQSRYVDSSAVPFGALSGKLRGLGVELGDFGLAIRHDQPMRSGFFFADRGGSSSYALGEVSQKVGTNLGGSGRRNHFNNNFPVSFIVFPHSASGKPGVIADADVSAAISAILAQLATAANADELPLLMGLNEVSPGTLVPGKAALDHYRAGGVAAPRQLGNVQAGLAGFGYAPAPAAAGAQAWSRSLDADDWSVNWDEVEMIPQPTNNGCWATAAAMVIGWRDRKSVDPSLLAQCNGMDSSLRGGLAPQDKRAFANALGLTIHPNACFTPDGFRAVLEANGPIWVTAKVPGTHAIVVTGMYRQDGAFFVRITDPWDRIVGSPGAPGQYAQTHNTGSRYIMTYDAFTAEFEAAGDIDRIQLLHSGGKFGHTLNTGSASSVGYAQGLAAAPAGQQPSPGGEFGPGVTVTRQSVAKNGRNYDLAQLAGMVVPDNALAGGANMPRMAGEVIRLDDWPYIDGPSGRTQAPVAIAWNYQGGAVGDVAITALDGQVLDGWSASARADIARGSGAPERAALCVRVTTTFGRAGEEDQTAVTEITLAGDGRHQTTHGADHAAPTAPAPAAPADRQLQPA